MMGRKLRVALAVLAMGTSLGIAASAQGGPCSARKCKNEVANCRTAAGCDALETKKLKKQCKNTCKKATKEACKAGSLDCEASPSGAFVDAVAG